MCRLSLFVFLFCFVLFFLFLATSLNRSHEEDIPTTPTAYYSFESCALAMRAGKKIPLSLDLRVSHVCVCVNFTRLRHVASTALTLSMKNAIYLSAISYSG